jgi:hypothetical protein
VGRYRIDGAGTSDDSIALRRRMGGETKEREEAEDSNRLGGENEVKVRKELRSACS